MRHIILALMIILLPVRGWVGDVMATEMVSGNGMYLQIASNDGADHSDQTARVIAPQLKTPLSQSPTHTAPPAPRAKPATR